MLDGIVLHPEGDGSGAGGSGNGQPQGGAPEGGQPQGGTQDPQGGSGTGDGGGGDGKPSGEPGDDPQERRLTNENRKLRERLKAETEARETLEREKLSETERQKSDLEKAQTTVARLTQEIQGLQLEVQILRLASNPELKVVDPEAVLALMVDRVQFDGEGKPADVEGTLKALIKDKPWLAGQSNGGGSGGGGPAPGNAQRQNAEDPDEAEIEKLPYGERAYARLRRSH